MKSKLRNIFSSLYILKESFKTDVKIIKKGFWNEWIDTFIWVSTTLLIAAYILPNFGILATYGAFMLAGVCASVGQFETFPCVVNLVADFEGDYRTGYYLTLPYPSWTVFVRKVIYYAAIACLLGVLVLPIGKLLLWNSFSFSQVDFVKYAAIFFTSNIFYGVLGLWTASFVPSSARLGSVWMRFVYPLWILGCFQFSWKVLYAWSPTLAYTDLLNPITYISEGHRAAILGDQSAINFWVCIAMVLVFSVLGCVHAVSRLRKRLDFV